MKPELVWSGGEGRRGDGLGFQRENERFGARVREVIGPEGNRGIRKGGLEEDNGEDEKGSCHDLCCYFEYI